MMVRKALIILMVFLMPTDSDVFHDDGLFERDPDKVPLKRDRYEWKRRQTNENGQLQCVGHYSSLSEGTCFRVIMKIDSMRGAKRICAEEGSVLPRFTSESQMNQVFPFEFQGLWVGADDLAEEGTFRWMADNKILKKDSTLWSVGEPRDITSEDSYINCVTKPEGGKLTRYPCRFPSWVLCMDLYDGIISVKVNNKTIFRNQIVNMKVNEPLTLECAGEAVNNVIYTFITRNDVMLDSGKKLSRVTYHEQRLQCSQAGFYTCNAEIPESHLNLDYTILIQIPICNNDYKNTPETNLKEFKFRDRNKIDKRSCPPYNSTLIEGRCYTRYSKQVTFAKAQLLCEEEDSVLAAFNSHSQMRSLMAQTKSEELAWIGAEYLVSNRRYYWIYDNKELPSDYDVFVQRSDDLRFNKTHNKIYIPNECVAMDKMMLSKNPCDLKLQFVCMNVYSDAITIKVNNKLTPRNHLQAVEEDSNLTLECSADAVNNSIINTYITFNDQLLIRSSNKSRLTYNVSYMACKDSGIYTCKAEFPESGLVVEHSVSITTSCRPSVVFSINGNQLKNAQHVLVPKDAFLALACVVRNGKDDYMLIVENRREGLVYTRPNSEIELIFNVTHCLDTGTYKCTYYQTYYNRTVELKYRLIDEHDITAYTRELNLIVEKCDVHIVSFESNDHPEALSHTNYFEGTLLFWIKHYNYRTILVCIAEPYKRPTEIYIKSYDGSIIKNATNRPTIQVRVIELDCRHNGKFTCELKDHITNQTYVKDLYFWMRKCSPSVCPGDEDVKQISPSLSMNASVSFCFMMNGLEENITSQGIFKNSELLDVTDISKYTLQINPSDESPIIQHVYFTVISVDKNDFGLYGIFLKFTDGKTIKFTVVFGIVDAARSSGEDKCSPFISYGVPIIVLLSLFALVFVVCCLFRKGKFCNNCFRSESEISQYINDRDTYVPLTEVE